jgi:glycosyltransferase involved in cell wall biosynthesis
LGFGTLAHLFHSVAMISVIIPTWNAARALPRCFESLIPGVVSGLVREVIVADGGSDDDTLAIADASGAHVVNAARSRGARMASGASSARGDWLLFLFPETALEGGWEREAEDFLDRVTLDRPRAATFRYALDGFDGAARRRETVARLRGAIFGLPYGDQGLLVPRRFYRALGGHSTSSMEDIDLIRRIGRRRLITLRSRAINKNEDKPDLRRNALLAALHAVRIPRALVSFIGE